MMDISHYVPLYNFNFHIILSVNLLYYSLLLPPVSIIILSHRLLLASCILCMCEFTYLLSIYNKISNLYLEE